MKREVKVVTLLMGLLFGCNQPLEAEENEAEYATYTVTSEGLSGKEYVSELGRFHLSSDIIRDEDKERLAAIKMSDIDGEVPLIDLVRVFIYNDDCYGSPKYFMLFSRRDNTPALPQVFAVPKSTCVEVEMYRRKHDNEGRVYDEIMLADKFKIKIR